MTMDTVFKTAIGGGIVIIIALLLFSYSHAPIEEQTITTTPDNLDNLKADCYTQGYIDGRGSILEEESRWGYKSDRLGVPEGYVSNRTNEWRNYADYIAGVHP